MSSSTNFWHDFFAGWIAGVCGTAVGHPFDTVKVRQQVMNTSMKFAIKATYKTEGIRGFYRGMLFPILTMGPSNSVFFGVYGNAMKMLQDNNGFQRVDNTNKNFLTNVFLAGCIAGFFQTTVTCPVEVVKTVLQADVRGSSWKEHFSPHYKGMTSAISGIVKTRGFSGLFQGLVPFLYRDIPSSGFYMITYEHFFYNVLGSWSEYPRACLAGGLADVPSSGLYFVIYEALLGVEQKLLSEIGWQAYAGGVTGVVSWLVVIPFDVIKSRIQADDPSRRQYKGMIDCIVKSYRSQGARVFFTGMTAICVRAFPVNCMTFVCYEKVMHLCRN